MATIGLITNLLNPKYIEMGYGLVENEDFVYLYKDEACVGTFGALTTNIEIIQASIDVMEAEVEREI